MKKILIPAFIVLMGAVAAFGTKLSAKNTLALVNGYHIDATSGQCVTDGQQCNTTGVDACLWGVDGVTELRNAPVSPTVCGTKLFKQ